MFSERLEPSQALRKLNVDASFVSVTAPRARLGHHHCADSHRNGVELIAGPDAYPSVPRARHDGSDVPKRPRSFVRVRTGAPPAWGTPLRAD